MRYGLSKSKRDQRRTFGYTALLLYSGALLFLWPSRKAKEQPVVPVGAASDYDPARRRELVALAGVGALGVGAAVALKAGVPLPNFSKKGPKGELLVHTKDAQGNETWVPLVTASGQAIQFPVETETPGGMSPGAMTYRGDLGQWIGEDGLLGHERFVGQQAYTVVSPAGLKNSLSTLYNAGWGPFGPDYPGTSSSGFLEGYNNTLSGGSELRLLPGRFVVALAYTSGTAGYNYIFATPPSSLASPTAIRIRGMGAGGNYTLVSSAPSGGYTGYAGAVILDCSGCTLPLTGPNWIFAPATATSSLGSQLIFENMSIIAPTPTSSHPSGGVLGNNAGGTSFRDFTISTPFTTQVAIGGVGIQFNGAGTDNTWSHNVNIGGFNIGAVMNASWNVIGSLAVYGCTYGVQWTNSQMGQMEVAHIDFLSIVECKYGMAAAGTSYPARFFIGSYDNYYATGAVAFPFTADFSDPDNLLVGIIVVFISYNNSSTSYQNPVYAAANTVLNLQILYVTGATQMARLSPGFGATQITVGANGVFVANPNPYACGVYVTNVGSGVTGYSIEDAEGNQESFTITLAQGYLCTLGASEQIAFAYSTTKPTVVLKGA